MKTILLVDDDDSVRRICALVLHWGGYKVLEADSIPAAIALFSDEVALLVTDLRLARNGCSLAARLRELRPDLPVLYISGDISCDPCFVREEMLQKPFKPVDLLKRVGVLLVEGAR